MNPCKDLIANEAFLDYMKKIRVGYPSLPWVTDGSISLSQIIQCVLFAAIFEDYSSQAYPDGAVTTSSGSKSPRHSIGYGSLANFPSQYMEQKEAIIQLIDEVVELIKRVSYQQSLNHLLVSISLMRNLGPSGAESILSSLRDRHKGLKGKATEEVWTIENECELLSHILRFVHSCDHRGVCTFLPGLKKRRKHELILLYGEYSGKNPVFDFIKARPRYQRVANSLLNNLDISVLKHLVSKMVLELKLKSTGRDRLDFSTFLTLEGFDFSIYEEAVDELEPVIFQNYGIGEPS